MLTADQVRTRRKGHELTIIPLNPSDEAQMLEVASRLIISFERALGKKRDALNEELDDIMEEEWDEEYGESVSKLLH